MGWAGSRREIIVRVKDGFSKLGSMVAGDAGWRTRAYLAQPKPTGGRLGRAWHFVGPNTSQLGQLKPNLRSTWCNLGAFGTRVYKNRPNYGNEKGSRAAGIGKGSAPKKKIESGRWDRSRLVNVQNQILKKVWYKCLQKPPIHDANLILEISLFGSWSSKMTNIYKSL